jgi:hypothetical protein
MQSIPHERCQVPSCPLTGGWENINHAVKPGCIRYNQAFNYDLSSNENKSLVSTLKISKRKQQHCCDCHGQSGTSKGQSISPPNLMFSENEGNKMCCECGEKNTCQRKCPCKTKGLKCKCCAPMANGHCRNIDLLAPRIPSSNIKPRIKDYDQLFQADPKFGNKARQEEQVQISSNVRAAMAFVAEKVAPLSSESFSNQSSQKKKISPNI